MAERTSHPAAGPASAASTSRPQGPSSHGQPTHQPDLDRPPNGAMQQSKSTSRSAVVQPKPQALPRRSGPASIIVSPRQKGNPILNNVKAIPWEYGDTPADYILGLTTCALFLSLKYHRLHPEYIYTRIRGLQGKYQLRIILCMVDIANHEEALKELTKTSVINNVTIILCWSAAEGGRYLELFKMYENAAPTAIKQHQSPAYSDRMVDFITTPRAINKTDAVALVSQFGTLRTAVNARHEDVATIAGWGEKKVQQWCSSVREPFRVQQAGKRGIDVDAVLATQHVGRAASPWPVGPAADDDASLPVPHVDDSATEGVLVTEPQAAVQSEEQQLPAAGDAVVPPVQPDTPASAVQKRKLDDDALNDGVMAALSKLRRAD